MGFWSSIGSAISSVGSAIGSAIGGIGSGISSALRTTCSVVGGIGKALGGALKSISSFAGNALTAAGRMLGTQASAFLGAVSVILGGPLGPILSPMILDLVIRAVIKVIDIVAKKLGLVEKEEKPEEIGYRMEEAANHEDWKKQEDFPEWKDYYEYLKQQIPDEAIDKNKLKENELHYQLLGMAAERQAIEGELGPVLPLQFLNEAGRSKMSSEEVLAFADVIKVFHWEAVRDYLQDKLPPKELDRMEDALLEALLRRCDGKTAEDLKIRLGNIRDASLDDRKLVGIYRDELKKEFGPALEEAEAANELPKFYKKEGQ